MKIHYIIILIICLFATTNHAQVVDQEDVRQELNKLDVDEEEVLKRLQERGFDVENIDPSDTEMVLRLQSATDEVIKEIQSEKSQKSPTTAVEYPSSIDTIVPRNIIYFCIK